MKLGAERGQLSRRGRFLSRLVGKSITVGVFLSGPPDSLSSEWA